VTLFCPNVTLFGPRVTLFSLRVTLRVTLAVDNCRMITACGGTFK
jgi:hypothetical protein